ncbi:MAG: hypothetical protein KDC85_09235 [Saprospiraceae bacterium]|nr:hypothetical protein [Saprospiraceae bacterium]MCB9326675.1 hypothetical protein [Lewinellaceae bacterium]
MDLREALLAEHSRAQKNIIADYVGDSKELFMALWKVIKSGEEPLPQRAVWALEECVSRHPGLFDHIMEEAITLLPGGHHDAFYRNITKILSQREIPEKYQGILFDLAIDWMLDPAKAVAIKAHCMTLAFNIAMPIPELREELAIVLKDQMEFNSAGFSSRGRKILKSLEKLNRGITNS